ncbi:hypothetical protein K1719_011248 [Acacia pycnantha]|nr:hypothetical protein K1719_011248 [Acacia pycnantha]
MTAHIFYSVSIAKQSTEYTTAAFDNNNKVKYKGKTMLSLMLEHLENPDLHVDSVRVMKLYSRIKEVVASLNFPGKFTLKDLLTPEANRTEFFLGALLNLCLHRETRFNLITDIVDEVNLLEEEQGGLETKNSQVYNEIL